VHRSIYAEEHELFRKAVRSFLQKEIAPDYSNWALHGGPPREIWRRAGELGILGIQVPEEFGGAGVASFKFNTILGEEPQAACLPLGGFRAHMDIVLPYLLEYATPEQKRRWLPGVATGETILAIGMTEPGATSSISPRGCAIATTSMRWRFGLLANIGRRNHRRLRRELRGRSGQRSSTARHGARIRLGGTKIRHHQQHVGGSPRRQPWNRLSRSQPLRPPDLGRPQAPYRRAACRRTGHPQSHLRTRRRRHRHRY
jgi:hypothetical protein